DGSLLDNALLLFGSGLKHGDYHSSGDLPIVVAGGGGGTLKTGRWVRYSEPQPYANLLLSLLHRLGIDAPRFGSSTGPLPGLDHSLGAVVGVIDDGTWRVAYETDSRLTARGLLHASEKIEESTIYYIRLSNGERLKIQARFRNLDDIRLDDY